ncbi:bromodomain-containing protein 4A-like isoform X2 [Cloeon dipterum]|uniref:bromodomain-containing protein 4A-like isoform X2 n=1 Tax=Cloeon dipterum TaxID=197152 RepID=UPI00321F9EA3
MDDIQSWWEVPCIAHFCSLFRAAFNLLDFDIEEIEEALLTDGAEDNGSSLLQELIVRLLCGCVPNGNEITVSNYQMYLRRLFRKKCKEFGITNPFNSDTDFQFLPLRRKVEILSCLCDFRLEGEDVQDLLKNLEADSLRVEPLGQDARGSAYWYFYGTRLYKETLPLKSSKKKKQPKSKGRHSSTVNINPDAVWQVICFTAEDWENLADSLKDSDDPAEKALHSTLELDFLPEIPRLFAEKEKLHMKRVKEFQPRRTSSRINKLNKQKEVDTKQEVPVSERKQPKQEKAASASAKSKGRAADKIYTSSEDEEDEDEEKDKLVKKFVEEDSVDSIVKQEFANESEKDDGEPVEDESKSKKSRKNRKRAYETYETDEEEEADLESPKLSKKLRSKHDDGKKDKKHKNSSHKSHKKKLKVSSGVESADEHKKRSKKGHSKGSSENESVDEHKKKKRGPKCKSSHVGSRHGVKSKYDEVTSDQSDEEEVVTKRTTRKSSPSSSKKGTSASAAPVGRQTNNSLACATGPIFIEEAAPKKKKLRSSEVFAQSEEDLQTGMYKILERLKTHPEAWPFQDAVEEDYAPNYYTIVRHPMDLQRMEDKLDSGRYLTFDDFKADFKLMIANCKKYNGSENEYSEMADILEAAFERASCRYLENDFSTDEEVAIEFSKKNAEANKHEHSKSKRKLSKSSSVKSPEPPEEEERHSTKHRKTKKKEKNGGKKSHRKHHHRKSLDRERDDSAEKDDNEEAETDGGEGSSKFLAPPVGPYGKRRAGPPQPPKVETKPKKSEKRKRGDSGDDDDDDETFNASEMDRENKSLKKEVTKSKPVNKKRKSAPKSDAAIEALEIATEQTLKDINKWLDDTPRMSEFSSASNSPAHYIGSEEYTGASAAIEREYRRSLRMDSEAMRLKKRRREMLGGKDKRKRDLQRTIDRLQPGKSKGNLIASILKAKDEHADSSVVPSIKPLKERVAAATSSKDDAAHTLNLGSVLTNIGFGSHTFKDEAPEDNESDDECFEEKVDESEKQEEAADSKEDVKEAKEVDEEEPTKVDCNKATPNLSAWFKAFGAPKAAPAKKKEDSTLSKASEPKVTAAVVPPKSPTPPEVVVPPTQRQRNLSTGSSSISDMSSPFSQDPEMSPRDSQKVGSHLSPPMASPTSPRTPFSSQVPANYPYNGGIKVGFYQEHKTSPEKSPRDEPSPMVPSPVQVVKPPQVTPPYSLPSRHYNEPQMAHYTQPQQLHQPLPPVVLEKPPQVSPPAPPVMQQPSFNQSSMLYDMSKPLTDQYQAVSQKPAAVVPPTQLQQPPPAAHSNSAPLIPDYSKFADYSKLNYPQPSPMAQAYKAQVLLPPQADPKVLQQYPVKKRMVYAAPEEERFPMELYQQNHQRLVQPSMPTYFDPAPPQVYPPYDLSASMPKEPPQQPVKPKRGRKKAEKPPPEKEPAATFSNFPLGGLKPPPGVVPGSAFNFGPPPGLHLYSQDFNYRNFKLKSPPPQAATAASAVSGQPGSYPVPTSDSFHQAAYYHHQFTQAASLGTAVSQSAAAAANTQAAAVASRSGYMMEQHHMFQQYLPRADHPLLHQGLYVPPPAAYHHPLGIRQPFEHITRPSWL